MYYHTCTCKLKLEQHLQAAGASSSDMDDDDDDDTPLAMLPTSTSTAKHTACSTEQTPAGPVRQLLKLTNPASSGIPDALLASSSNPDEQADMPAAGQSMQVKTALLPSKQDAAGEATDTPVVTPHREDTGPLAAAKRTEDAAAAPSATALPSAEARQAVSSSTAKVEGDMTQGRHDPHQPAASVQERKANTASGPQAVPAPGAEAGIVVNPQPLYHQDQLISDSESEGPPFLSLQSRTCPAESMPGSVTEAVATVHASVTTTLQAAGDATPISNPCHTRYQLQQQQQQQSSNNPAASDGSPVVNSSESLLQAEAEAARLVVLLAPPVYRPPALAHQLADMGTGVPVQNTSTSCTQASLHAQSESPQAASVMAGEPLPANVKSGTRKCRTAEAELPGPPQYLQAARGLSTSLGSAQLPEQSRQDSMQQENADLAALSGLPQLAMQVNRQRLKTGGDLGAVNEGPASAFEQEHAAVIHEEDAADVVIPDR